MADRPAAAPTRSGARHRNVPSVVSIRLTTDIRDVAWLALRAAFVPELSAEDNAAVLAEFQRHSPRFAAFIAEDEAGAADGFAEVSVRRDYVNGCRHRPALYLEGIYVRPTARGRGLARALCEEAARWGSAQGCREFASDVSIDDTDSLAAHQALGFQETERVVYFRRPLDRAGDPLR